MITGIFRPDGWGFATKASVSAGTPHYKIEVDEELFPPAESTYAEHRLVSTSTFDVNCLDPLQSGRVCATCASMDDLTAVV